VRYAPWIGATMAVAAIVVIFSMDPPSMESRRVSDNASREAFDMVAGGTSGSRYEPVVWRHKRTGRCFVSYVDTGLVETNVDVCGWEEER
jgi:hypothetical protein